MEFSGGVCSCVLKVRHFIVYEHMRKPHSSRTLTKIQPWSILLPRPRNVSQGSALQSLAQEESAEVQSLTKSRDFLHQSCASEQKAKTALTERNRQQSKHRFQCFIRKNYFKRLLWISLSLSFILQKMLLMSLLTCFQQCTIFACPVGNCEASKYRKSKDKDVS